MNIKSKIKSVKTSDIKPYKRNAKIHSPEQIKMIAESMTKYGTYAPIVCDKNLNVIVGHGRLEALKLNGDATTDIVYLQDITPKDAKKLRILDNKIVSQDYDKDMLQAEIESLYNNMADDIDKITEELAISEKELNDLMPVPETDGDDDVPDNVKAITKLGDLWELGKHRVLCGDSTDEACVNKLMDGKKADMVFTDPPYGMSLDTDWSDAKSDLKFYKEKGCKGTGNKYDKVKGDNDDFTPDLIDTVFNNFDYCKEIFLWGADYYAEYLKEKNNGSWVVWDKRSNEGTDIAFVKQSDKMYGSCFELCWSKARHKRMLARVKWAGIFGTEKEFDRKRHHPTQKPMDLILWFFDYYSLSDKNNVVDLYLGSGATLLACEKTNRICYGMELDEHYCDVIVQRYIDFCTKNDIAIDIKRNGKPYNIARK